MPKVGSDAERVVENTVTQFEAPPTRGEAVLRRLRSEIVDGQLEPGSVLRDAELAERLGTSITPVREAIAQLAAEGLVDIAPNRIRRVAGVNQKSALELMDVMELLACGGFSWGVANLTAADIVRIRQRYGEFVDALDRGDVTAASAAGADCSTIVVMASGNRELQPLIDVVVTRTLRMLALGAGSHLWTAWRRGYGEVVDMLERDARDEAVIRYRQIYSDARHELEEALWHHHS